MTRLDTFRQIVQQPVDGDKQPGSRVIYDKADPSKVTLPALRRLSCGVWMKWRERKRA